MSGGTIGRCADCRRLLIVGQRCMCVERPESRCDCTHDGNDEHQGPTCRQREADIWSHAISHINRKRP